MVIENIHTVLPVFYPFFFTLLGLLFLIHLPKLIDKISEFIKDTDKTVLIILSALVLAGFVLRAFVFPANNFYFLDEHYAVDVGNNMAETGQLIRNEPLLNETIYLPNNPEEGYNSEAGYFYIVGMLFKVFGSNSMYPIVMNIILGSLTVLILGIFGLKFFGKKVGLISTGIIAILHFHLIHSFIGEKTVASVFFISLFLLSSFYVIKKDAGELTFFAFINYLWAGFIRPEFFLFFLPITVLVFYTDSKQIINPFKPRKVKKTFFYIFVLVSAFLAYFKLLDKIFFYGTGGSNNFHYFSLNNFFSAIGSGNVRYIIFIGLLVFLAFSDKKIGYKNYFEPDFWLLLSTAVIFLTFSLLFTYTTSQYLVLPYILLTFYFVKLFFDLRDKKAKMVVGLLLFFIISLSILETTTLDHREGYREGKNILAEEYDGEYMITREFELFVTNGVKGVSKTVFDQQSELLAQKISEEDIFFKVDSTEDKPYGIPSEVELEKVDSINLHNPNGEESDEGLVYNIYEVTGFELD